MRNSILLIVAGLLLFSCTKKEEKAVEKQQKTAEPKCEKKFDMYEMSEMATLMEQMYVDNQRLKERIIKGDTIGEFPNHFLKIHKAVMTDKQEN